MVDLTLTGSGTVGEIKSWNMQVDATPVSVGDSSGSVGAVSVTTAHGEDSEFVINNASTFTHPVLGKVSGQVAQLSSSGATEATDTLVSMQLTTPLTALSRDVSARLVASHNALELEAGVEDLPFVPYFSNPFTPRWDLVRVTHAPDGTAIYLYPINATAINITRITSAGNVSTITTAIPTTPTGAVSGFVADASNYYVAANSGSSGNIYKLDLTGAVTNTLAALLALSDSNAGLLSLEGSNLYILDPQFQRVYVRFTPTMGSLGLVAFGSINAQAIAVAGLTQIFLITGSNGVNASIYCCNFSGTLTASAIIPDSGANFFPISLQVSNVSSGLTPGSRKLTIVARNSSTAEVFVGGAYYDNGAFPTNSVVPFSRYVSVPANAYSASLGDTYLRVTGDPATNFGSPVRKYLTDRTRLSGLISYYLNLGDVRKFSYLGNTDPFVVAVPWSGDLWSKMKDLLSVHEKEIISINDVVTVRDWGSYVFNIENVISGTANLSVDSRQSGTMMKISNYETTGSPSIIVYNGVLEAEEIAVGVNATTVKSVSTINYPTYLSTSTYSIKDAYNLDATAAFAAAGGTVTLSFDRNDPTTFTVTMKGPTSNPVGFTPPYEMGTSLLVYGPGVSTQETEYSIPTGGDSDKTFNDNSKDINNIFIDNIGRMFDSANRYSAEAAGGVGVLKFSISMKDVVDVGSLVGALVPYKESMYRINSIDTDGASLKVTARHYVTTGAFDTNVSGKTTGQFDAFWSGNDTLDVKIKPLRPIV